MDMHQLEPTNMTTETLSSKLRKGLQLEFNLRCQALEQLKRKFYRKLRPPIVCFLLTTAQYQRRKHDNMKK